MLKLIKLSSSGKNKQSLFMHIPSDIAKALRIDPLTTFFLLKVTGHNRLELKILRTEELDNNSVQEKNEFPVDEFKTPVQQITNGVVI